jgi:hypothetical protein
VLGPQYELLKRDLESNPLLEARSWDPESGFQVILRFPEAGGDAGYERFKSRLARSLLGREGR